jgi:hypothetical protein
MGSVFWKRVRLLTVLRLQTWQCSSENFNSEEAFPAANARFSDSSSGVAHRPDNPYGSTNVAMQTRIPSETSFAILQKSNNAADWSAGRAKIKFAVPLKVLPGLFWDFSGTLVAAKCDYIPVCVLLISRKFPTARMFH